MTSSARPDAADARPLERPPTGTQYVISQGDQRAVVTQVGATLREYTSAGAPLVDGFDVTARASDGRGQVLAPWPNRLADGRFAFGGHDCQAALDEPARGNAIHGLVRWLAWSCVWHDTTSVSLSCVLRPQPGYAWQLDLSVGYRLASDGLTVTGRVFNASTGEAPFGLGFHPYLTLGAGRVEALELLLPARSRLSFPHPDSRPAAVPVSGTALDFTAGGRIGSTVLDTAMGDLSRGPDGRAVSTLVDPARNRGVELWQDQGFPYLMVYTADRVHDPARRRRAVAVEPMTCPPHALRSGTDLIRIAPGQTWQATWGLRPLP